MHKHRPDIGQHLLDLALVHPSERKAVLRRHLEEMRPDIVAFSWRNMQSFGPHPEDDALDVVMNFDHARNPWRRIKAAKDAVRIIYDYAANRLNNFAYMRLVRRLLPESRIVVGGTAVSIFGKEVAEKCPPDSMGVVGEGEDTMLSIVNGEQERTLCGLMSCASRIRQTVLLPACARRGCPAASAPSETNRASAAIDHNSAARPWSLGLVQAMLTTQAFASSVISGSWGRW